MRTEAKRKFLIDIAFFAVIAVIIYLIFKFLSVYLLPFVIGILVTFLVQRPVKFLHRKTKIAKGPLTVFLVIFLYIIIVATIILLCFLLYRWLASIAKLLPGLLPTVTDALGEISTTLTQLSDELPEKLVSSLNDLPANLISGLTGGITNLLSKVATTAATGAPALLVGIIITLVASCYIAKDYDSIIRFAYLHTPKKAWAILNDIKDIFMTNIFKMLKGYLLLMLITFVELNIGLLLIGQNNSVVLSAIICVVDILPVLGTGTVVIPWALICLITGNIWKAIGLLLLYIVITVVRNFLEPKVIGEQVGLHPLITLLSMFCGLKLLGVMGVFLFPLTLIVLNDLRKRGKITFRIAGSPAAEKVK